MSVYDVHCTPYTVRVYTFILCYTHNVNVNIWEIGKVHFYKIFHYFLDIYIIFM